MTDTFKSAIASALIASGVNVLFGLYQQNYQSHQANLQKIEQQTQAQKANMLDFVQSLEKISYELQNQDFPAFDQNAAKFSERMQSSDFSSFLDARKASNNDDSFGNEVAIVVNALETYRKARMEDIANYERNQKLLGDSKSKIQCRCREMPYYIAAAPIDRLTNQLRSEMAAARVRSTGR